MFLPAASASEKLLIAPVHWQLPTKPADECFRRAVEATQGASWRERLRFAELSYAMDRPDLAASLELPVATRIWLEGQRLARRGELNEASQLLTQLPPAVFPARLGIWTTAAPVMSGEVRDQVLGALDGLTGRDPMQDAAVEVTRYAVSASVGGGSEEPVSDARARVAAAAPEFHDDYARRVETSARTPSAQLHRALDQDPSGLREKEELLGQAPISLIDDLIDEGIVTRDWLATEPRREVDEYLAARLDPTRLDDSAVERFRLYEERARRCVLRGDPLPEGLPPEVAQRYEVLSAVANGTLTPAAAIDRLEDIDYRRDELQQALDWPESVPSNRLLQEPLAKFLLGQQALDSLDLDGLNRARLNGEQPSFVGSVALERSRRALYAWQYDEAIDHAKACLRLCEQEPIRDEALNLIAAASWQLGQDGAAIRALETALDGEYTFALQANIGIVAQELEPSVASHHLAKLIGDAPTLQMRVQAAKRTLAIWRSSELPSDQENDLPDNVASEMRKLLCEPINPDDFRQFARLLADHDAGWMATFDRQTTAPHAGSSAARLYAARARGIDDFIRVLSRLLQDDDANWLTEERDQFVQAVIDALLDDEPQGGAVSIGDLILEYDVPMDPADRIVLQSLMARMVAFLLVQEDDGEPAIHFLDGLEHDAAQLSALDPESRERASKAVEFGFDSIARAYLANRWGQIREAAKFHDEIAAQISRLPRRRRNDAAVQEAASNIERVVVDSRKLFKRLRPNVGTELVEALDEGINACSQLIQAARSLPRM